MANEQGPKAVREKYVGTNKEYLPDSDISSERPYCYIQVGRTLRGS
jgi:hypothetical protein